LQSTKGGDSLSRAPPPLEKPPAKPESNPALDELRHIGGPGITVGESAPAKSPGGSGARRGSVPKTVPAGEAPSNGDLSVIASLQPTMLWRPIGGPSPSAAYADKPVMRHEIVSLLRRLQFVMLHVDRLAVSAASGDQVPSSGHSVLDSDFGQCRAIISRAFSLRTLPAGAAPLLPSGTRPEDYAEGGLKEGGENGGREACVLKSSISGATRCLS
jgi:hypothetical protein